MSNLDYVKLLASQTATDISGWDLRMFNRLEDKNQINKVFFEHKNTLTTKTKVVPKRMVKKLKVAKLDPSKFVKKLESSQNKLQEKVIALYKKIEEVNKLIVDQSNKINNLNNSPGYILEEEINKVLQQGYWENPIVEKDWLYFNTKNEIICSVSNSQAGVDLKINLGKYAVALNLKTLELKGLPFENNLIHNDTTHPFIIATDGHVCWGNAIPMLSRFKRELSLSKTLNLFYVLLSVYDDTSHPFTPLSHFNLDRVQKIDFKLWLSGKYSLDNIKPKVIHPDIKKKYLDTKTKKV